MFGSPLKLGNAIPNISYILKGDNYNDGCITVFISQKQLTITIIFIK